MAKNIARGTTANSWVLPKLVFAVALVGFIALVMTSPAEAATLVKTGGAVVVLDLIGPERFRNAAGRVSARSRWLNRAPRIRLYLILWAATAYVC